MILVQALMVVKPHLPYKSVEPIYNLMPNVTIVLDGVVQIPSSAYAVTASTLNFSEAPTSGTEFHGVLAGQSQFIESDFIVDSMIKSTNNIRVVK